MELFRAVAPRENYHHYLTQINKQNHYIVSNPEREPRLVFREMPDPAENMCCRNMPELCTSAAAESKIPVYVLCQECNTWFHFNCTNMSKDMLSRFTRSDLSSSMQAGMPHIRSSYASVHCVGWWQKSHEWAFNEKALQYRKKEANLTFGEFHLLTTENGCNGKSDEERLPNS